MGYDWMMTSEGMRICRLLLLMLLMSFINISRSDLCQVGFPAIDRELQDGTTGYTMILRESFPEETQVNEIDIYAADTLSSGLLLISVFEKTPSGTCDFILLTSHSFYATIPAAENKYLPPDPMVVGPGRHIGFTWFDEVIKFTPDIRGTDGEHKYNYCTTLRVPGTPGEVVQGELLNGDREYSFSISYSCASSSTTPATAWRATDEPTPATDASSTMTSTTVGIPTDEPTPATDASSSTTPATAWSATDEPTPAIDASSSTTPATAGSATDEPTPATDDCSWHQVSTYDENVYSECEHLGQGPEGPLSDCKIACCQTAGCNTINYSDTDAKCNLKSCGPEDLMIKPWPGTLRQYAIHTVLASSSTTSAPIGIPTDEPTPATDASSSTTPATAGSATDEPTPATDGQCVEANNAQQWPDLINGQYVLDESLDKCGSIRASYRRVDGQSFIWFNNPANAWIGSTEICNDDNSVKQFFSPGADSPSDVFKDSFFEQNAARNGWLSTKGMEIIQCAGFTQIKHVTDGYYSACETVEALQDPFVTAEACQALCTHNQLCNTINYVTGVRCSLLQCLGTDLQINPSEQLASDIYTIIDITCLLNVSEGEIWSSITENPDVGCKHEEDMQGFTYHGQQNVTVSGRTCQRWDSNEPHSTSPYIADYDFPDGSISDAANFCRNPDGESGPWCYTTDPETRWELCDVPICTCHGSVRFNTTCSLSCEHTHYLAGTQTPTTCGLDGWPSDRPVCLAGDRPCIQTSDLPPNVMVSPAVSPGVTVEHPAGTVLMYSCLPGYAHTGAGDTQRLCQAGIWTGTDIQCEVVTCPSTPLPNNTLEVSAPPYHPGNTLTLTCLHGYEVATDGSSLVRECQLDGTFAGMEPVCHLIECPAPATVPNTNLTAEGHSSDDVQVYQYEDTIVYTCSYGYEYKEGSLNRSCLADKTWSGEPPLCIEIDCGAPPTLAHTTAQYTATAPDSKATYSCKGGHRAMGGQSEATCGLDGQWSPAVTLQCEEILCPSPPAVPAPAFLSWSGEQQPGSVVLYACPHGTKPSLDSITMLECQPDGTWSHEAHIQCQAIEFGPPPRLENTESTWNGTTPGSVAWVSCEEGMQTMTEATTEVIECLPSGWQDASISCAATDCGLPLAPAHSVTSVTSTTFGSTAMFMCSPGYTPTESDAANIVTCEAEGTWTNTAFSCQEIEISLSSAVGAMSTLLKLLESTTSSSSSTNGSSVSDPTDNGTLAGDSGQPLRAVVDTGELQIGSVVTFSCIAGYQLEGNETLSVTQLGQLDGDIPLCTEIQCPEANIPVSTALNVVVSSVRVNATLSFSCDKGWLLVQTGQIRCGPDRVWHGDMPYCEVAVCSPPSSIPHGHVSSQQPGSVGARITYTCEAGYKLEDGETGTAECMPDGAWSHPPPTCEAVTCPNLPSLGPHMQMVGSSGDFGSVLVFVCNDGYVMNSSDTNVTCQHSGQWSQPNDTLACEVLDCGRPPRVENATVYHTSTVLAAVASYSCLPDYDLRAGDAKRACGVDGAWGGTDIVCTYIPGGKKVEIFVPKENLTEEEVFYESIGFKPVDRRASNFSIGTVVGITFISLTMAFFIILDMSTFQPGKCVKAAKKLCIKNSVNPV